MDIKGEYYEIQRFNQPMLWVLLILCCIGTIFLSIFMYYHQIVEGKPFGDQRMSDEGMIIYIIFSTIMMILLLIIFRKIRLEIRVTKYGLHYRYFPLIQNWRYIDRSIMENWEVKRFFSIRRGMRFGLRFFTIKIRGNTVLELRLSGRRNIRLGTQQPDDLRKAMERLFNRGED